MRFSPWQWCGAAAVVLALTVGGVALRAHDQSALTSARDAAHAARIALAQSAAQAARADSVAVTADAKSRVAARAELSALAHADSATHTLAVLRERYRVASAAVPDTCRPIQAAADSALAEADSVTAALHVALTAADERGDALQVGLDTTRAALSQLRAAATASVIATARFEHAAKPPFLSRFLKALAPRVGVGVAAGLDLAARPALVTGLTLGWSF